MKTKTKALVLALSAVLLVATTVFATVAFLTSTDSVVNTFSVGQVGITLDEAPVGADGKKIDGDRVKANAYTLVPGGEYDKDPTVHVAANSEDSYIFVEVINGIAAIEGNAPIAAQIAANGWTALDVDGDGVADDGVYYKEYTKNADVVNHEVFSQVTISENADNAAMQACQGKQISVIAYAIQRAGFENNVVGAWEAVWSSANG